MPIRTVGKGRDMAAGANSIEIDVAGKTVAVSNPDKVFFSVRGETKLDLVRYYLAVGEGALRGVARRPTVLKRYPEGATGPHFFQKRVPHKRPGWLQTVVVEFPSGEHAEELCPIDVAHLIWAVNLGCLDFNPWPVRREDLEHPDELRVDLDPQPGIGFPRVRELALEVRDVLEEVGLTGWPKTSGSRGMHVLVPIAPRWGFTDVRRAALALARELERRRGDLATAAWWKQERGEKIFVDYNQNARDRTVASAYSVRANPEARVSAPLSWGEVPDVDPAELTLATMPARYRAIGDPHASAEAIAGDLSALLELAVRQAKDGHGDAPWPPHFAKQPGEPPRVAPGRRRGRPLPG